MRFALLACIICCHAPSSQLLAAALIAAIRHSPPAGRVTVNPALSYYQGYASYKGNTCFIDGDQVPCCAWQVSAGAQREHVSNCRCCVGNWFAPIACLARRDE